MGEANVRGDAAQRANMAQQRKIITLTSFKAAEYVNGLIVVPMEGMMARFALIETTMPDIEPQVRFVGVASPWRLKSLGEHFVKIADEMIAEVQATTSKSNGEAPANDWPSVSEETEQREAVQNEDIEPL